MSIAGRPSCRARRGQAFLRVALIGIFFSVGGCGPAPGWNLPVPEKSNIKPKPGVYDLGSAGCFEVAAGGETLLFSADCYRTDEISIVNGAFTHAWGEILGLHCPTDSYGISGTFVSETHAEGTIKYASDCRIVKTLVLVATTRQ